MAEAETPTAEEPKKKKRIPKTLVIIIAVAVVEAGAFFGAIKLFGGGPQTTYGADGEHVLQGEQVDADAAPVEVYVLKKLKVPNGKTGRTYVYDFDVAIVVVTSRREDAETLVLERGGEIADRFAQIVRAADPRALAEADLNTIRLKFRAVITEIARDEQLVQRVLIPRWVPIKAS